MERKGIEGEIQMTLRNMQKKKASGRDRIPNEAWMYGEKETAGKASGGAKRDLEWRHAVRRMENRDCDTYIQKIAGEEATKLQIDFFHGLRVQDLLRGTTG